MSPKEYPPPALRRGIVSGLHWTMPNGTSAPGNELPPPVVHVRVSTSWAGSVTGVVTTAWLFALAGSLDVGSWLGQLTGRPSSPSVHTMSGWAAAVEPLDLAVGGGLGLGLGAAVAGAAVRNVAMPSTAAASPATIRNRAEDEP